MIFLISIAQMLIGITGCIVTYKKLKPLPMDTKRNYACSQDADNACDSADFSPVGVYITFVGFGIFIGSGFTFFVNRLLQ